MFLVVLSQHFSHSALVQDMFKDYKTVLSCNDPDNYCQFGAVSYWNADGI
jgi:hypothetical protein